MASFEFYFSTAFNFDSIDGFHLLQDHVGSHYAHPWDDYDYIVTFQIYRVTAGVRNFFGRVKVLAKGWQNTSEYFRERGTPEGNSYRITDLLKSDRVVSLASDTDYYRRIGTTLGDDAKDYLRDLCDGSYYYDNYWDYSQWPGFSSSLFRSSTVAKAVLKKGHQVALGKYEAAEKFSISVDGLSDDFEPVTFNFDNKRTLGNTNINLLIGRNGSGKSHILRHLVELLTGVIPNPQSWPYFHKVIVAAYSPFESFRTESQLFAALNGSESISSSTVSADQKDAVDRRRLLVNEYAYVGFKDARSEFSLKWPKESSARALKKILDYDSENVWWGANSRFVTLFRTLRQSIDFDALALTALDGTLVAFSEADASGRQDYAKAIDSVDYERGIEFLKDKTPIPLSSGQTIYSYLLPCLVAEIDDESLLILDEPELYLHPAMEVGLINMLKGLLEETKSNAIIASHSSILAREVERTGVVILRREGGRTIVSNPGFETFGQSIEMIMGEAFDDYRVRKAYEASIDRAAKDFSSAEAALNDIGPKVGDEALAYLAAKFQDDSDIQFEQRSE